MNARVLDSCFDILYEFVAEDLPDVLALDSFPVDPREIGVGKVIVVVPDAVIIDADELK